MQLIKLTQYSHGAGCGCKISPKLLDTILQSNFAMPNNDRLIVQTIDDYTSQGWELYTVTTGVQSPAENKGGTGIYMTRYLFRRPL